MSDKKNCFPHMQPFQLNVSKKKKNHWSNVRGHNNASKKKEN